jgi:RHS repeat-associated protein
MPTTSGAGSNPVLGTPLDLTFFFQLKKKNGYLGGDKQFFEYPKIRLPQKSGSDQKGDGRYYPFGLTMAGVSDKALKTNYAENKYRYSGKELQHQEFSDGSGLEEYDYGARMEDPQLGRWMVQDQSATKYFELSPYVYVENNPFIKIDPDGREVIVTRAPIQFGYTYDVSKVLPGAQLAFPPRSIHDLGVTGIEHGAEGVSYSKNAKTGKYDVKLSAVSFVNGGLQQGGNLNSLNPGLETEVAAHEEGHRDQIDDAFHSSISVNSGYSAKEDGKTTAITFTGSIDQVLDQASKKYDEMSKANPELFKDLSKSQFIEATFKKGVIEVLRNMPQGQASETDANNRAAKKLGGKGKMPYTNGTLPINL